MEFSRRTEWDTAETAWARLLAEMRRSGARLLDLTASNPTHCGLEYDAGAILAPLTDLKAMAYDPDPRGSLAARQAICRYYAEHGLEAAEAVDPRQLLLTASTSEGYSFLFRLLCDPGDEILIAQPSYPLFDFLARLDDVRLSPYELFYDHGWQIDLDGLRRRVNAKTRAIVVVHPNNPTGHFTHEEERAALEAICREFDLALIVDEVFLDYGLSVQGVSFGAGKHDVLTFLLSGVSKIAGLPQMKVSWIACFGDGPKLSAALERLEVIADSFLSVSAPVQCALPSWLNDRHRLQRQISARTARNLASLDRLLTGQTMVTRLEVEAGWYVVLRVPALAEDEATALALLAQRAVAVHPGYFFGFAGSGWLVMSLLPVEEQFTEGVTAILDHFNHFAAENAGGWRNQTR